MKNTGTTVDILIWLLIMFVGLLVVRFVLNFIITKLSFETFVFIALCCATGFVYSGVYSGMTNSRYSPILGVVMACFAALIGYIFDMGWIVLILAFPILLAMFVSGIEDPPEGTYRDESM